MRVRVELPQVAKYPLRDVARIVSANRVLLVIQLVGRVISRNVLLEIGKELSLRSGKKGQGYRCRVIFLGRDNLRHLLIAI